MYQLSLINSGGHVIAENLLKGTKTTLSDHKNVIYTVKINIFLNNLHVNLIIIPESFEANVVIVPRADNICTQIILKSYLPVVLGTTLILNRRILKL